VLLAYSGATARLVPYSVDREPKASASSPLPRSDRQSVPRLRAMLLAGLDGIKNKIDPGPAMTRTLRPAPKS